MSLERPNSKAERYLRQKKLTGLPLKVDIAKTHWEDDLEWWMSGDAKKRNSPDSITARQNFYHEFIRRINGITNQDEFSALMKEFWERKSKLR